MTPSALQSLYECRHESQEKWTLWAVAMSKAWPEMYRGLSAAPPREPTMKMLIAAQIVKKLSALPTEEYADIWQAMYDAAPKSTPPPAIEVIPKLGEAMEVLRELVVLEDLGRAMAKAFSPRPRDPKYILTDDELTKYSDLCAENARRKPLAWAAARAILAAPIAPKESS